jgi:hypothetical protein
MSNEYWKINDIVTCQSGNGRRWIGYVINTYEDGELMIKWYDNETKMWHRTRKFKPAVEDTLEVVGPLPWNVVFDDGDGT